MFKRMIVAVITLAAVFCLPINVEAVKPDQSPDKAIDSLVGTFDADKFEYTARDAGSIGNGNGRDGGDFHPAWEISTPPMYESPIQEPTIQEPFTPEPPSYESWTPEPPSYESPIPELPVMSSETYNENDEWLIYLYVCGTNLESGLEYEGNISRGGQATADIQEMEAVKLPPNVKILIQTGTTAKWNHHFIKGNGRYLYDSNGWREQPDGINLNMYEPATLESFLRYGENNYNADHRILIFWDHGGVSGVCQDQEAGGTLSSLSFNNLRSAIKAVYGESPAKVPFEIIGFDTCLMGSYESANNVSGFARYMVASEENENGNGWYYTDWLAELAQNPTSNGAVLGEKICSGSLREGGSNQSTFSVVDMGKFYQLRKAHEEYFTAALNRAKSSKAFVSEFSSIVDGNDTRTEGYDDSYVDLKSLAINTQYLLPEASNNLLTAIDSVIVSRSNGSLRTGGGISTYYPYKGYLNPEYMEQESAFGKQKELYSIIAGDVQYIDNNRTAAQDEKSTRSGSRFNIDKLTRHPISVENNQAVVRLTPDELENVSRVSGMIVRHVEDPNPELGIKEEGGIILGSNISVKSDRANGIFRSNLSAFWPALDGHLISIERTFSGNGYELFDAPVILNGQLRLLQISYDTSTKKYNVERAIKRAGKDGIGSRDTVTLKEGDEVIPLFLTIAEASSADADEDFVIRKFYNSEGQIMVLKFSKGMPFKVGSTPTIEEKKLDDDTYYINLDEYGYFFFFYAPDGTATISNYAEFYLIDDEIHFYSDDDEE